jgi:hypothetical protein
MRNSYSRSLLFAFLATALSAAMAAGQTQSGTVEGSILDGTGQVLPGVSVTLTGQGSSEVSVSSGTGTYRFFVVPPGIYTLRFELGGFQTRIYEEVRVDIARTTGLDVALELSTIEETVTVVGEAPLLDTKSTVIGATFDASLLAEVPSARDVWSLLEHQAPGVTTNRLDVGGSETGLQAVFSARGTSWGQNSYYLNGVNVTCPAALGASGYYYDYDSFEEVQVEVGSHPASVNAPGVYLNMVTKTGKNEFAGSAGAFYQNDATQFNNFSSELEAQGGTASAFDYLSDFNGQIGGPVIRDRSTFYFSFRDERVHRYVSGVESITEDTDMRQFVLKSDTDINQSNKMSLEWHEMTYWKPRRGLAENRPPEATWIEDDTFRIVQANWTSTLSESALLDTRFSHLNVWFPTYHSEEARAAGLQAGQDVGLGVFLNARDRNVERRRKRYSFKSSLTYFAEEVAGADHELHVGVEYSHNPIRNETTRIGDVFLRFNNGEAFQVDLNNTPRFDGQTLNQSSAYIDDIITAGRLTLKLGLRWDRYHGWLPAQDSPEGTWCKAANGCPRSFAERKGLLDLASVAPRLGLIIGLEEGGTSALKVSWGRYYHQFSTGFANFVNQNGSLRNRHEWNDLNGDDQFQDGEQGAILSDGFGAAAAINTISSDLKHEYTDELTMSLEREFEGDIWVQATFSIRNGSDKPDRINLAAPDSAYDPMPVTDPGPDGMVGTGDDGGQITVYNLRPEFVGLNQAQIATIPGFENSYRGVELTTQKRFSNNWQALVSYTWNDTEDWSRGGSGTGNTPQIFTNPNQQINAQGKSFYDRTHQFKGIGTWHAPRGVRFSGVIRYQTGQPVARTFFQGGLNQGGATILSAPIGSERLDNVTTFDIALFRDFQAGRFRVSPELNLFNITNQNTVSAINTSSGANYGRISNYLSPRIARVAIRVSF